MATLLVELDDALLARVLNESQEQEIDLKKFISEALDAFLTGGAPAPARRSVDVEALLASAVKLATARQKDSKFMLVDLFEDKDWDALSGGERKSLGKGFRKTVEGMIPPVAKYVGRTSSNKAVYKRV